MGRPRSGLGVRLRAAALGAKKRSFEWEIFQKKASKRSFGKLNFHARLPEGRPSGQGNTYVTASTGTEPDGSKTKRIHRTRLQPEILHPYSGSVPGQK